MQYMVVIEYEERSGGAGAGWDPRSISAELLPMQVGRSLVPCGFHPSKFDIAFIGEQDEAQAFLDGFNERGGML